MTSHSFQQGELAYWLAIVAANGQPQAQPVDVPAHVVQALAILRCVEVDATGVAVITDKGRLALRMEQPGARNVG